MSARARHQSPPTPASPRNPADTPTIPHPHRPIPPQRVLLGALSTVFFLWMAFLVYLYLTTVYPNRSVAPTTAPTASFAPHAAAHSTGAPVQSIS